jgi:hypothetical protein
MSAGRITTRRHTITLRRNLTVRSRSRHTGNLSVRPVTRSWGYHTRLPISHHSTTLRREAWAGRVIHRAIDIASGESGSSCLLHPDLVALSNLTLKLLPPNFATLSKRDIEGFGTDHLVVHLCNSFCCLVRS